MSDKLEIDVHLQRLPYRFTVRALGEFTTEQLQLAMDICNKHCGNPTKDLGGPRLPTKDK